MDSFIAENAQRRYQKEMESRRNAGMLANILREQIKQANVRKERERREKYSYNWNWVIAYISIYEFRCLSMPMEAFYFYY